MPGALDSASSDRSRASAAERLPSLADLRVRDLILDAVRRASLRLDDPSRLHELLGDPRARKALAAAIEGEVRSRYPGLRVSGAAIVKMALRLGYYLGRERAASRAYSSPHALASLFDSVAQEVGVSNPAAFITLYWADPAFRARVVRALESRMPLLREDLREALLRYRAAGGDPVVLMTAAALHRALTKQNPGAARNVARLLAPLLGLVAAIRGLRGAARTRGAAGSSATDPSQAFISWLAKNLDEYGTRVFGEFREAAS